MTRHTNPLTNAQQRALAAVLGLDERRVSSIEAHGAERVLFIEYTAATLMHSDVTEEQREAINAIVYPTERVPADE